MLRSTGNFDQFCNFPALDTFAQRFHAVAQIILKTKRLYLVNLPMGSPGAYEKNDFTNVIHGV